jgi:hypothetical protein
VDVELRQRDEATARQTADLEQTTQGDQSQKHSTAIERMDTKGEITAKNLEQQARMWNFDCGIEDDRSNDRERGGGGWEW